ncbi:MAG: extracellular solute-binding protein [Chloroflexi bacterium]|nr:extracellular solute-binding protein [Chloroflexota bacterium]
MKTMKYFPLILMMLLSLFSIQSSQAAPIIEDDLSMGIATENSRGSVAILVIDDFGFDGLPLEYQEAQEGNCTVNPSGQGGRSRVTGMSVMVGFGRSRVTGMVEAAFANIPHGYLVYEKFIELFSSATRTVSTTGDGTFGLSWMGAIEAWEVDQGDPDTFLVQIDTGGYNTDVITSRISEAIHALAGDPWEIDRYVLNMSFGVVPCDLGDEYEAYREFIENEGDLQLMKQELLALMGGGADQEDLLSLADGLRPDAQKEYLLGLLRTHFAYGNSVSAVDWRLLEYDPLSDFLDNPSNYTGLDIHVVGIAAAGNHSKDYPFAPALWEGVVSVSAPPVSLEKPFDYSNAGEVMMDGVYRDYLGTSFAAPELSYHAAVYLLEGGFQYWVGSGTPTCSGSEGDSTPPLAYASESGPWDDLPLNDASQYYCGDFLMPGQHAGAAITPLVSSLTIWADSPRFPALAILGEEFKNRYDVEIIIEEMDFWDIQENFVLAASAGAGPDIVMGKNEWLGTFVPGGLVTKLSTSDWQADFAPAAVQAFDYEGAPYGVPFVFENVALFYNPDYAPYPPTTWEELSSIAAELQSAGVVELGFVLPAGLAYHFYPVQTAFGGYIFGSSSDGSYNFWDVGLDNDGSLAAAQWLENMLLSGLFSPGMDWETAHALFEQGKAAMIVTGPWVLGRFRDAGVNYAVAELPSEYAPGRPLVSSFGFMISSTSPDPLLAEVFLTDFVATETGMQMLFDAEGDKPSAYTSLLKYLVDPDLRAIGEAGMYGAPIPAHAQMPEIWEIWEGAFNQIVNQETSSKEAFYTAAEYIREIMP